MKNIKDKLQASEDEQADSYQLKTDEEIIDIISQFGNGVTEFHTLDINRLIEENQIIKKRLGVILIENNKILDRFEFEQKQLISKMGFCQEHKFAEEERIARLKHDSNQMIILLYRDMHNQIQQALNSIK